jgi:O-antigen ligase
LVTNASVTIRKRLGIAHQRLYHLLALLLPAVFFLSNGTTKTFRDLIALLFLIGLFNWKGWFRMDRVTWPALLLAAVILGGYLWQRHSVPPNVFGGWHADRYVIAFGFFIMLAYGTITWKRIHPTALLISAAIGLLLHLAIHTPAEHWLAAWRGARMDFGFQNAQHAGIMFATALLGISLACIAFFALMLWGVLVTQVRAVWLGLVCSLLATIVFALIHPRARLALKRLPNKRILLLASLVLAAAATAVLQPIDRIERRLAAENISVEQISGATQFKQEYMSSSGIRIATWTAATGWILERPLLGWGARSVKQLLRQNPDLDKALEGRFGHLHNTYLELSVAVGLIAVALMFTIIFGLAKMTEKQWKNGKIPTDTVLFLFGFLTFWAVVNMFESYLNYRSGFIVNTLICAFAYAWCIQSRATAEEKEHTRAESPSNPD